MGLGQFVDNNNDAHFHSSEYAKAASGDSIGSANTQSFGERVQMERGRKAVRRYGDSLIGRGHMRESARNQLSGSSPFKRRYSGKGGTRPGTVKSSMPQRTFNEPPTRYNPYG